MKEIQRLVIRETSIEQTLRPILHWGKENSRAIHNLDKEAFHKMLISGLLKIELSDKYQGDRETFHLLKIIDQDVRERLYCTRMIGAHYLGCGLS